MSNFSVTIPSQVVFGTMATPSVPWTWNQNYILPDGQSIVVPVGFNGSLCMPDGVAYPPGYHIANGSVGGGFPAPGALTSNTPIIIQPPMKGTGMTKFFVQADMYLSGSAAFSCYFGVAYPSGPVPAEQPMWPWLGVGHVEQVITAQVNGWYHCHRLDVVADGVNVGFGPGGKPPTWPAWQVEANTNNSLYPALQLTFNNVGPNPIEITGLMINATAS